MALLKKALLIEDYPICLASEKAILEDAGFQVDVAPNATQGLDLLNEADLEELLPPYYIIFVDINLPDMQGDVIAEIVQQTSTAERKVPIVAVTAYTGEKHNARYFAKGISDIIEKPLTHEKLQKILKKYS